ncbi:MAG: hypothetical protein ISS44_01945 [Candidatus Omnitrophica bacterium]|nr:hypothetical protein [Candidatus Omnitrophota bacterium]
MGIIHKLKPEVKDFILEQKKSSPDLSCRGLSALIMERFQLKLGKSRINWLLKGLGLSGQVGRKRKKRRRRTVLEEAPKEKIFKERVIKEKPEEIRKVELPPKVKIPEEKVSEKAAEKILEKIMAKEAPKETPKEAPKKPPEEAPAPTKIPERPAEEVGKEVENIILKAAQSLVGSEVNELFNEGLILEICFAEGEEGKKFYLDAQFHTLWSGMGVPVDFAQALSRLNNYINKCFHQNYPLLLFTAPGYDVLPEEFFDFLGCWQTAQRKMEKLTVLGSGAKEVFSSIITSPVEQRGLIFGLWPWQFMRGRKIKATEQFQPYTFAPLKLDFYLAEGEIKLAQPKLNRELKLRACLLKRKLEEKVCLIICTNLESSQFSLTEIVNYYLSAWPNLEECFGDFSRKIELFTYTAGARKMFLEALPSGLDYLGFLDAYIRRYFLPVDYEDVNFATMEERIYNLSYEIKEEKDFNVVEFTSPSDFAYLRDLDYLCHRLNEREIIINKKHFWFKIR